MEKHPVTTREARRHAVRHDGGLAKKATRKYRRDAIEGLQNQQTALGLARVFLGGAGTPAMRENVLRHIQSMALALARETRPEVFADDTLTVEDQESAERAAVDEALEQIGQRLQEVLDGSR
jgi:hypothetical protein